MNDLDWNLLKSFAAVAEAGSLSGAARQLGTSQPTLGRHVAELEEQLGIGLFARHPRGLELTEQGTALYEQAREVRTAIDAFGRRAVGLDEGLAGTVRISASEVVAIQVLPPMLTRLRALHPGIDLEIVADNRVANLLRRDADLAVRMVQPTQEGLIARKVAEAELGLFASEAYLAAHPPVESFEAFFGPEQTILGMDRDDLQLQVLARMGMRRRREDFRVRTDSQAFSLEAAIAGLGIVALQAAVARRARCEPPLRQVATQLELSPLPVYLVAHEDLRRSARVRAVYDLLAEELRGYYSEDPP